MNTPGNERVSCRILIVESMKCGKKKGGDRVQVSFSRLEGSVKDTIFQLILNE